MYIYLHGDIENISSHVIIIIFFFKFSRVKGGMHQWTGTCLQIQHILPTNDRAALGIYIPYHVFYACMRAWIMLFSNIEWPPWKDLFKQIRMAESNNIFYIFVGEWVTGL